VEGAVLLADGSVLTDRSLWNAGGAAELMHHFAENLDESDRTFEEKLRDQLEPTSASAKQLAAEDALGNGVIPRAISSRPRSSISFAWNS
jgi:hypothetical protein